jgi:outer membrane lipoprotein-sorting protein
MNGTRSAWLVGTVLLLTATVVAARADEKEKAQAVLEQTRAATAKLQTLRADFEATLKSDLDSQSITGTIALKRPNLARCEVRGAYAGLTVSDGKTVFLYGLKENQYRKSDPGPDGRNIQTPLGEPISGFFRPQTIGMARRDVSPTYAGKESLEGMDCDVVELAATGTRAPGSTTRYFISSKDHLIHQLVTSFKEGDATFTTSVRLKNVRTDLPIDDASFQWTPPATARLFAPSGPGDLEKMLVPVGKPAPDFNLPTPRGGQLSLSDARKGKKATLVNFWFYG